jgi:exonuclease III
MSFMGRCLTLPGLVLALCLCGQVAWSQSQNVVPRSNGNLVVCAWNIKWFKDTGRNLTLLAKVISNFDLCGIVELQSDKVLEDLKREVVEIAKLFNFFKKATKEKDLILAGDFNYTHSVLQMAPIRNLPNVINLLSANTKTTLKGTGEGFSAWYDYIYVDSTATVEATGNADAYDFIAGLGFTSTQEARKEISDHLPVWAEFRTDSTDDD